MPRLGEADFTPNFDLSCTSTYHKVGLLKPFITATRLAASS
jgi:hypothetical protein